MNFLDYLFTLFGVILGFLSYLFPLALIVVLIRYLWRKGK